MPEYLNKWLSASDTAGTATLPEPSGGFIDKWMAGETVVEPVAPPEPKKKSLDKELSTKERESIVDSMGGGAGDYLANLAIAGARGAGRTIGLGVQGAGQLARSGLEAVGLDPDLYDYVGIISGIENTGRNIQQASTEGLPTPRIAGTIPEALSEGLGSVAGIAPAAMAGPVGLAGAGASIGYAATYNNVKELGGTEREAKQYAAASALVGAATEPFGALARGLKVLRRAEKATGGWIGKEILKAGGAEALQETLQEIPDEVARKAYIKDRTLWDSARTLAETGALGGTIGMIVGGISSAPAMYRAMRDGRSKEATPTPQPGGLTTGEPLSQAEAEQVAAELGGEAVPGAADRLIADYESRKAAGQQDPVSNQQLFTELGYGKMTRKERAAETSRVLQERTNAQNEVEAQAQTQAQTRPEAQGQEAPPQEQGGAVLEKQPWEMTRGEYHKGKNLHGSFADPTKGRAGPGSQIGLFTSAEESHASWYANSDIRNETGNAGDVYAASPPSRPLDLRTKDGLAKLVEQFDAELESLRDAEFLYGFDSKLARAKRHLSDGDFAAAEASLKDAALSHAKLRGVEGIDDSFFNVAAKRTGADAVVSYEVNPATGKKAQVTAYLSMPPIVSHKQAVASALAAGKPVPHEVLADYPDLQQPAPKPVDQVPVTPQSEAGVEAAPESQFSLKNAVIDQQREARGLPPLMTTGRMSNPVAWDAAMKRLDANPALGEELVESLEKTPRAVDTIEELVVLRHIIDLHNRLQTTIQESLDAHDAKDAARAAQANNETQLLQEKLDRAERVDRKFGTITGQALQARKIIAREDYSLVSMVQQKRAANEGRPLTIDEQRRLSEQSKRIAELEERIEALEAERTEAAKPKPTRTVRVRTEKARANLDAVWADVLKHHKLFSNPLDPEVLADGVKLAKAYIDLGVAKFSDFMEAVTKKVGRERAENARPALEAAWEQAAKEDKSLKGRKARMRKQIAEYNDRLNRRDFSPKPPRRKAVVDKELDELTVERDDIRQRFRKELEADRRARMHPVRKAWNAVWRGSNLIKEVVGSFDWSAMGRHGFLALVGNPLKAVPAVRAAALGTRSKVGAERAAREIRENRNYANLIRWGLELTNTEGPISQREEEYISGLSGKIPGVAASARAYVATLNKVRVDLANTMLATHARWFRNEVSDETGRAIVRYVNEATMRGGLGNFTKAANELAAVFWTPRGVVSRFQWLMLHPLWHGTAQSRILVAKEYAKAAMGIAAIYASAYMALTAYLGEPSDDDDGWEIETDPRSSDFLKIRVGKQRIDFLAGLIQPIVFGARVATGQAATLDGKERPTSGFEAFGRFLRTKLSPGAAAAVNIGAVIREKLGGRKAKDVTGQPLTPFAIASDTTIPMNVKNVYEEMVNAGVPEAVAAGILGFIGVGVNTYEEDDKSVGLRIGGR